MNFFNINLDMSSVVSFLDTATPIMEGIVDLHNHIFFYLILILIAVSWVLGNILILFFTNLFMPKAVNDLVFRKTVTDANNVVHGTILEIVWTIIPCIILILIVIPSFALLYSMDEVIDPVITLKVIGHQWYWSYEYTDTNAQNVFEGYGEKEFDSYMVDTDELELGDHRLLEVDNQIILPIETHIRVIVTADDVLHCWAVPSLGIKIDAVPGRLSQVFLFIQREGVFYGQCSELCGINHGFMPIAIKAVTLDTFINWMCLDS